VSKEGILSTENCG